jgi:tetratricopeptide (TPR) repeat protein
LYQQGKSAEAQKRYGQAMNYYKRALQFVSGYGPSRQAIQSLHSKANNLYAQAVILVGVDDKEARNLLKQILQMLPPSDRLYKKAQAKLRSF